jgi:hypothetical protein
MFLHKDKTDRSGVVMDMTAVCGFYLSLLVFDPPLFPPV